MYSRRWIYRSRRIYQEAAMSRVQLALNVADLEAAIGFYSKLFGTAPAKVRPGYANFAVDSPPLKLVLVEGHGEPGTLNHLGVEVPSTAEVRAAQSRLAGEGLATTTEDQVSCCHAVQDKVWVDAPGGEPWEIYTVLADVEMAAAELRTVEPEADVLCCATVPESAQRCC
jgi:catechol 2,3-dioxygenase-like lactoylglutathione lyase family enzyme